MVLQAAPAVADIEGNKRSGGHEAAAHGDLQPGNPARCPGPAVATHAGCSGRPMCVARTAAGSRQAYAAAAHHVYRDDDGLHGQAGDAAASKN